MQIYVCILSFVLVHGALIQYVLVLKKRENVMFVG
jgi:hypothetical protein